jgi:hypothetical protein
MQLDEKTILFSQTDPNHENYDDVVGLCSGQFVTQDPGENPISQSQSYMGGSQTPDTLVLTNCLTQTQSFCKTQFKEVSHCVTDTQSSSNAFIEPADISEVGQGSSRCFLDSSDSEGKLQNSS